MYKTKFHIDAYKKVCGTCKSMKQDITPKRTYNLPPKISQREPPMSDLKKLRDKFNTSDMSLKKHKTPTRQVNSRVAYDLRDCNYDDLIKIIERLEAENADLKAKLQDALTKLSRMESRDEIILQY